jgi:YD repeat-containing protein
VAAFAPTVDPGTASEQIYYAKNISSATAGSNTVTVTYSKTVPYPEIRILEYSGISTVNPFDVGAGGYGTGATQNSGSFTTTSPNEVLVASNDLSGESTAAGTGYTQRFVTPVNELVEDEMVTTTGAYSATSTQSGTSWWVIQVAAFRAATGTGDTTPPTAPTGLTATVASSSQINLGWTASTDNVGVTGYRIERCTGASCTAFAEIGTSTTTTYSATGLTASTSYNFRIRATDAAGNLSTYSSTASGTTSAPVIAYVQGTSANSSSSGSLSKAYASAQVAGDLNVVIVSWNDGTSTVSSVTDSKGNTYVSAFAPTVDPGTASEQIYYAKNIGSATAGSNTVTVTYSKTVPYPEIRILEYSGIDTVNPFDVGAGGYGTGATQNSGSLTTTSPNEVLVASNDLSGESTAAGTGYTQRFVTPVNELVEDEKVTTTGTYSATSTQSGTSWWVIQVAAFRAATGSGDTTPPTAPTGLTATVASSSQINLSWTASTDNVGVTGYRIESCSGTSCTTFAQIGTSTTTTYNATGLTASTSYNFRIRATDAAGNLSTYSSTASGTTSAGSDTTPPTAPTGLTATVASSSQINLSWTASTDNVGVTGYRVESCSGASCTTFAQIGTPTTTTYNATGLTASTSYSFRVRATDAAGNLSSYSTTAGATTSAPPDTTPPTAPGTPTLTVVSSSQINLSWTASTDNVGVTSYLVERCQGTGCSTFTQIATPAAAGYGDTGLSTSTSYSYRVRATDAAGNLSSYSGVASATTGNGSNTYSYDANGRLSSVTTAAGTLYYHYDAAGNVTTITPTP